MSTETTGGAHREGMNTYILTFRKMDSDNAEIDMAFVQCKVCGVKVFITEINT